MSPIVLKAKIVRTNGSVVLISQSVFPRTSIVYRAGTQQILQPTNSSFQNVCGFHLCYFPPSLLYFFLMCRSCSVVLGQFSFLLWKSPWSVSMARLKQQKSQTKHSASALEGHLHLFSLLKDGRRIHFIQKTSQLLSRKVGLKKGGCIGECAVFFCPHSNTFICDTVLPSQYPTLSAHPHSVQVHVEGISPIDHHPGRIIHRMIFILHNECCLTAKRYGECYMKQLCRICPLAMKSVSEKRLALHI